MSYERDRELARAQGIAFKVCTKAAQGQPWEDVEDQLDDLHDAMILASHLDGYYQVGVLACRDGGGFIYWTSKTPDLFNSAVIEMELTQEREPPGQL